MPDMENRTLPNDTSILIVGVGFQAHPITAHFLCTKMKCFTGGKIETTQTEKHAVTRI